MGCAVTFREEVRTASKCKGSYECEDPSATVGMCRELCSLAFVHLSPSLRTVSGYVCSCSLVFTRTFALVSWSFDYQFVLSIETRYARLLSVMTKKASAA